MSADLTYEFKAPQFLDSFESTVDDGADDFFSQMENKSEIAAGYLNEKQDPTEDVLDKENLVPVKEDLNLEEVDLKVKPGETEELVSEAQTTRVILHAIRKRYKTGSKPLPRPPTVPQPFNLTQRGQYKHKCTCSPGKDGSSFSTPSKQPSKKRRIEGEKETSISFKASKAKVLSVAPFWPEIERRVLPVGRSPMLATKRRVKEWALIKERKRKLEEKSKLLEDLNKKDIEEEIRILRKAREFKATSIKS